jgi:hypothetical protein
LISNLFFGISWWDKLLIRMFELADTSTQANASFLSKNSYYSSRLL